MKYIALFCMSYFIIFMVNTTTINAQGTCNGEWVCDEYYCDIPDCNPPGTRQINCTCNGQVINYCDPGFYPCNRGCCEIGTGGGNTGGGGVACTPATNCPVGWTPAFNQTPTKVRVCDQSDPKLCSVGTAQQIIGCCGSGKTDENGEWSCGSPQYATYPCCPPGTSDQCVVNDTGNNYTYLTQPTQSTTCQDQYDQFVSATQSNVVYRTYRYCDGYENPDTNKCEGERIWVTEYYYNTTCRDFERVCSCTPTCSATAPSAPALLSPANGSSVTSPNVSLIWNNTAQDWGTSCVANSNQYEVYIGTSPSSLALLGTVGSGTGSASFSGTVGTTYYWKVRAKNGSQQTDSAVWSFTINDGPWWQVKDGDVTTNNDITSDVPDTKLFNIVGLGGFPGVPVFGGTFSLSNEPTKISETVWNANTTTYQSRIFNYSYFDNLIPDDVVFNNVADLATGGSTYTDGYEWFKATGDVSSVGDINIGSRKVILFVEAGNLNINGKINLTDGVGFFGAFVDGNITVSESVAGTPSLEGIYLSDGVFSSGTTGTGDSQLHIRGSVASFGGINLQRNLVNNTANPAELLEFAPDQIMLFPEKLMYRRSKWQEIAP